MSLLHCNMLDWQWWKVCTWISTPSFSFICLPMESQCFQLQSHWITKISRRERYEHIKGKMTCPKGVISNSDIYSINGDSNSKIITFVIFSVMTVMCCVTCFTNGHSHMSIIMNCILNRSLYVIMVAFEDCSINFEIYASYFYFCCIF